jgi:hypothetical protein
MSRLVRLAAIAMVVALAAPAARTEDNKPPAGFTALFNGKNLEGWKGHTTMAERAKLKPEALAKLQIERTKAALEQWSVKDGAIHLTPPKKGAGVSLVTEKDYGNFELFLDWKIEKNGDSGIYLRGQPQVQIWDSENTPGARGVDKNSGSGGLWNNPAGDKAKIPLKKADKPVGQWNTFHITVKGDEVTVELNGVLVVDKGKLMNYWERGKPVPAKGPIELQFHGDPLWFKNIYIKELQ